MYVCSLRYVYYLIGVYTSTSTLCAKNGGKSCCFGVAMGKSRGVAFLWCFKFMYLTCSSTCIRKRVWVSVTTFLYENWFEKWERIRCRKFYHCGGSNCKRDWDVYRCQIYSFIHSFDMLILDSKKGWIIFKKCRSNEENNCQKYEKFRNWCTSSHLR